MFIETFLKDELLFHSIQIWLVCKDSKIKISDPDRFILLIVVSYQLKMRLSRLKALITLLSLRQSRHQR